MKDSYGTNMEQGQICLTALSYYYHPDYPIISSVVRVIVTFLTIISNTTLIYALHKTKQLNTISMKLILIMSLSDLGFGIFAIPTMIASSAIDNVIQSCVLEKIAAYLVSSFAYFSFGLLICISVDRYLQVTKLNRYTSYMNNICMKVSVALSFAIANAISLVSLLHLSFVGQVIISGITTFSLAFMAAVNTALLLKLHKHAKTSNISIKRCQRMEQRTGLKNIRKTENTAEGISVNESHRKQLSAIKTIQVLLVFILATYIPYNVMSTYWSYYKIFKKIEPDLAITMSYHFSCLFIALNTSGNAWIIIHGNRQCRRFVLSPLRRVRVSNDATN